MDATRYLIAEPEGTRITAAPWAGDSANGQPPVFMEACIESSMISSLLQENQHLELGEKTMWTTNALLEASVFDEMFRAATDTVKLMEKVGCRGDNQQDRDIHRLPREVARLPSLENGMQDWG